MGRYDPAWCCKLARVLYNACPTADLGSYLVGVFVSSLVLFLQMALDLIWPYRILALLAYGYLVLCQMVEILTRYACFGHAVTLRFLSLMGRPLNLLYASLSVLMVVAGYIPLGPNFGGTRQPLVVSADPLTNTTLTCNASSTYALPRKLGYCKSCWRYSSMARKTYPKLGLIRQRHLNPPYP
jgi:hypothetical protein